MKFYFGVVFFCIQKVSSQTLSLLDYALRYQCPFFFLHVGWDNPH